MTNRKVPFVENEYYHIYSRGNSKQKIFFDEKDYERFVKLLYLCNTNKQFKFRDDIIRANIDAFDYDRGDSIVSIGAWVLMPNHFHIYLAINPHMSDMCKDQRNYISEFIRKLLTAYTKYINTKYKRTGGLFESAFKSEHVSIESYAKYLFSYIHLNPIKLIQKDWKEVGIKNFKQALNYLKGYKWSSYQDYLGVKRKENIILNSIDFPDYFSKISDFEMEIQEWLDYKNDI